MRCTKNGRVKFAVTRILAAGCIFVIVFIFGIVIHLSIINLAFGTECLKTSFQMLFSIINLSNINLGQLQVILVLAGLFSVLASISCTLFLSAKCKDSLSSLLISLAVMLLPTIIYTALGGSVWISTEFWRYDLITNTGLRNYRSYFRNKKTPGTDPTSGCSRRFLIVMSTHFGVCLYRD